MDAYRYHAESKIMIRIALIPEQSMALEQVCCSQTSKLAERCLAVLRSARGDSAPLIAESLGRHEHTIRKWLKTYEQEGMEGLQVTPPSGRTNRKGEMVLILLKPVLVKTPSEYGYIKVGWTTSLLLDYLRRLGYDVSKSTIRRTLKRGGWVYKPLTKITIGAISNYGEKRQGWIWPSLTAQTQIDSCIEH